MISQRQFLIIFIYTFMVLLPLVLVYYYDLHLQEEPMDAIQMWYLFFVLARGVVGVIQDWWMIIKEEYDYVVNGVEK